MTLQPARQNTRMKEKKVLMNGSPVQ